MIKSDDFIGRQNRPYFAWQMTDFCWPILLAKTKTKIQSTINPAALPPSVLVSGNSVDIVESFVYLGSEIHTTGSS